MAITRFSNDKTTKLAPMIVFLLLLGSAEQTLAFNCREVLGSTIGCVNAITRRIPSLGCCEGLKEVRSWVSSAADCQQVCTCAQTLYRSITGIERAYLRAFNECGVNFGLQFSPSMDCSMARCA